MQNWIPHHHADKLWLVFRVLVGVLFFMHGAQKFGLTGGEPATMWTLMWWAGLVELVVGVLTVLGLLTMVASALGGIQMLVAYFKVHAPQALSPLTTKGELALLFFGAFLVLLAWGAGRYSVDALLCPQKKAMHGKHK